MIKEKSGSHYLIKRKQINVEIEKKKSKYDELLLENEGYIQLDNNEKPLKVKQNTLIDAIDLESKSKCFKLNLAGGPFKVHMSKNGRYMIVGGNKGLLATIDCLSMKKIAEIQVQETIRDAIFLHNHTFTAVAQKKYLSIYDQQGIEVHCLRDTMYSNVLQFLPYHFLLTCIGEFGCLRYLDISTGTTAANHKTKRGPCDTMCQNEWNAVITLGHNNGSVSMWVPNTGKPVVEFLAHSSKVTAASYLNQYTLATTGLDSYCTLWDIRKYEPINKIKCFSGIPCTLSASQTELLAIGFSSHVQIWNTKTDLSPFLLHSIPFSRVHSLSFRNYEDFCMIGTTKGVESIVVPGSGFANYDANVANPYENKRQQQQREISSLIEKLPPSTIRLEFNDISNMRTINSKLKINQNNIVDDKGEKIYYEINKKKKKRKKFIRLEKLKLKSNLGEKKKRDAKLRKSDNKIDFLEAHRNNKDGQLNYDALSRFKKKKLNKLGNEIFSIMNQSLE